MANLVPVDHDPFAGAPAGARAPQLVPVDHDPFAEPSIGDTAVDVAKSVPTGLAKFGITTAGLPGDIGELGAKGIDAIVKLIGMHLGVDPESLQRPGTQKNLSSLVTGEEPQRNTLFPNLPGSESIRHAVEGVTGPLYEAKTGAGKLAQTVGEFAPNVIGGGAPLAVKLATRVLVPAAASAAAGEATGDNPYAKMAAAIGAGALAHRMTTPGVPTAPRPTTEQVRDASRAGYRSPEVAAVQIQPAAVERFANGVAADLNMRGQLDNVAPQTHNALERLRNTGNVPGLPQGVATIAEIDSVRKNLVELGKGVLPNGRPTSEATAANHARQQIDRYLNNLQQPDLVAGNAQQATQTLRRAQADWASAAQAEDIGARLTRAERQAARSGSGSNIDNAVRQKVSAVLDVPSRSVGLRPEEVAQAEMVVRGSPLANVLRKAGKFGFNDGLSLMLHAGAATATGGKSLALGAVGTMARKGAEAVTQHNATRLEHMILDRSAEAGRWRAANARLAANTPRGSSTTSELARLLALGTTDERLGLPTPNLMLRTPFNVPGQQPVPR